MLVGTMESKILYIETGCIRWRQELCWLLMPGHLRPHHKYAVTELSWGLFENANCGIQVFRTVSSLLFCFKYTTILDAALYGQSPAASCWPGAGCALWPCDHRPVPCQVRSAASTPHFLQPQIWDVFVIALASGDCMTPTMRRCLLLTFHWPPLKLGYMRQFRIFLAPGAKVQTS